MTRYDELMGKLETLQPEQGEEALLLGFEVDEAYVQGNISADEWRYIAAELASPVAL